MDDHRDKTELNRENTKLNNIKKYPDVERWQTGNGANFSKNGRAIKACVAGARFG
jgi:hypothetical protein